MGHAAVTKNYKKKVLLDVVKEILPENFLHGNRFSQCIGISPVSLNCKTRMS